MSADFDIERDIRTFEHSEGCGIKVRYRGEWLALDPVAAAVVDCLVQRIRALDEPGPQPGTIASKGAIERAYEEFERQVIWTTALELVRAGHTPQNAVELAAHMRHQLHQVAITSASPAVVPADS